jgi:hypothetical protein
VNPIEKNARLVLTKLYQWKNDTIEADGDTIARSTQLTAEDVNDAVNYLTDIGAVEPIGGVGTDPFDFGDVTITSKGKWIHHEWTSEPSDASPPSAADAVARAPRFPVGSPFGFKRDDWEFVAERQRTSGKLYVVVGLQYDNSNYYNAETLLANLKARFDSALRSVNEGRPEPALELVFEKLAAGYGEHLFNHIARCIIGADIAVFDTSDLNPNVMIELGVALTWGGCLLPVRAEAAPPMPSDISGQTWIKHRDSGKQFLDADFSEKLVDLVGRAVKAKSHQLTTGTDEIVRQANAMMETERSLASSQRPVEAASPSHRQKVTRMKVNGVAYLSCDVELDGCTSPQGQMNMVRIAHRETDGKQINVCENCLRMRVAAGEWIEVG